MSVKVMGACWELDLAPASKVILLALADHADHQGRNARPSIELISWKTGYSTRQVQRAFKELRDAGIITPEGGSHGGRSRSTSYRITPEKGDKLSPFREAIAEENHDRPSPFRPQNHDRLSPFIEEKGDTGVTVSDPVESGKGDICDSERVTSATGNHDTGVTRIEPSEEPSLEPETVVPTEPAAKPRSPKQLASDRMYERRMEIFTAYCAGLEIPVDGLAAEQRKGRAFRSLTTAVLDSPECTPEEIEVLARYTAAVYSWRTGNTTPQLSEVLAAFPEWQKAGRPNGFVRPPNGRSPTRTDQAKATQDYFLAAARGET